jgi:hypothetical protein
MNRLSKLIFVPVAAAVLVACGGGGSDTQDGTPVTPAATTPPATTPPAVTKYTQADVKNVASIGVLFQIITANDVTNMLAFASGAIQGASESDSDSNIIDASACIKGGTFSRTITKSMQRVGLAVGDKMEFSFVNCDFDTGVILDGALSLVAKSDAANLADNDYRVLFDASATAFVMRFGTSPSTFVGTLNSEYIVGANGSYTASFAVPAGLGFVATLGNAPNTLTYTYFEGATFKSVDVGTPNSASRKLDGKVSVKTATTNATPLTISTPTALSGTVTGGIFTATSGSVYTTATAMNLATSVAVSGTTTTVNGDTNGDNVMDLSFTTAWQGLFQ